MKRLPSWSSVGTAGGRVPIWQSSALLGEPGISLDAFAVDAGFFAAGNSVVSLNDASQAAPVSLVTSASSNANDVLTPSTGAITLSAPGDSAMLASLPAGTVPATGNTSSSIGASGATSAQLRQALDEGGLSVNGSGITVGVLSDSFNNLGGAAADEADGALPSASHINVIKDLTSGGTDEGRAMMQVIHDLAPGANEAFYTASNNEQDFANGILALAAAGCKVIVDDVTYPDEPFFQNGVVAQAIKTVEAEGVTYVTAAGNNAENAYQAAWAAASGTAFGQALSDAESFNGSLYQTVTINTEGTSNDVPLLLEWNQAFGTVSSSTADLELLVFNSSGTLIGTATNQSFGESTNPWVEYNFTQSGTYYVAIENLHSGTNPGLIKEITAGDGLGATISGSNAGAVYGHGMTPGAITVGAVAAPDTPAFGVNPPLGESFSSSGAGDELLFADNGTALASPDNINPVVVSGVDDISTTMSGSLGDFFGTSAASATLAGEAALILSADPNLTTTQVQTIIEDTAVRMSNSAVSGDGLAQIDPAVTAAEAGYLATAGNAPLAAGATAVMVMNNPNTGVYEIYDIGGNAIQSAYSLGQVFTNSTYVGLGTFQAGDSNDMLLRDSSTGAFKAYYIGGNTITSSALVGTVGTNWNFAGIGGFDGASSLSELLLRNSTAGSFELYQVAGGGVLSGSSVAAVGNNFSVEGLGHFSVSSTTQMMMQDNSGDASNGQLELYTYQPSTASFGGINVGRVGSNLTISGMADLLGNASTQMVMQQNNGNFWLYSYSASTNTLSGQLVGAIGSNFHVVGFGPLGSAGQDEMLMQDASGDFEAYQYNASENAFVGISMGKVGSPWVVDGIADPPGAASTSQLIQAMASMGGGAGASTTNSSAVGSETTTPTLLTTPLHT